MGDASSQFHESFATLRGILQKHGRNLVATSDTSSEYCVASPDLKDRSGKPLFVAGVQIKKNYVSYHLMPVYADPALLKKMSPALRKRMQGKSCFNFTSIEPALAKELAALTKEGIARFRTLDLPWARDGAGTSKRKS